MLLAGWRSSRCDERRRVQRRNAIPMHHHLFARWTRAGSSQRDEPHRKTPAAPVFVCVGEKNFERSLPVAPKPLNYTSARIL